MGMSWRPSWRTLGGWLLSTLAIAKAQAGPDRSRSLPEGGNDCFERPTDSQRDSIAKYLASEYAIAGADSVGRQNICRFAQMLTEDPKLRSCADVYARKGQALAAFGLSDSGPPSDAEPLMKTLQIAKNPNPDGSYGPDFLSHDEFMAINDYTYRSGFRDMNIYLRADRKPVSPAMEAKVSRLIAALDKIKHPKKGPVYRGTRLPPEVRAAHKIGAVMTEKSFTSTSYVSTGAHPGRDKFLIYNATAKGISAYAGTTVEGEGYTIENEREVLFPPQTRFFVIDILREHPSLKEYRSGQGLHYTLAEMLPCE